MRKGDDRTGGGANGQHRRVGRVGESQGADGPVDGAEPEELPVGGVEVELAEVGADGDSRGPGVKGGQGQGSDAPRDGLPPLLDAAPQEDELAETTRSEQP